MEHESFTKTEIDYLLKRARYGQLSVGEPVPPPNVEPFDFHGANRLSSGQITKLLELHTSFANQIGRSLSTILGTECTASPESLEQLTYGDLVKQFPESTFFGTLDRQVPEGRVLIQADLALVLPMIDLLLGGQGTSGETIRHLTEIEREIFRPVIDMFGVELSVAWAPFLETVLQFGHIGAVANLLPATEKIVFVKFKIQVGELTGMWTLILPMLLSNALTRKLEQQLSRAEGEKSEENQHRLREKLMDSCLTLELYLPPSGISVRKLAHLKTG